MPKPATLQPFSPSEIETIKDDFHKLRNEAAVARKWKLPRSSFSKRLKLSGYQTYTFITIGPIVEEK